MKKEIKDLYKKDPRLAIKVAKVLGYTIIVIAKKPAGIDEVIDYVSKNIFNLLNKAANLHGYRFKMSANDFEKFLGSLLVSKLK